MPAVWCRCLLTTMGMEELIFMSGMTSGVDFTQMSFGAMMARMAWAAGSSPMFLPPLIPMSPCLPAGIAVGDYKRNGGFNFLVTNVEDNILLQRQPDGTFLQARGNGLGEAHVSRVKPSRRPDLVRHRLTQSLGILPFMTSITMAGRIFTFRADPLKGTQLNPNALLSIIATERSLISRC